MRYILTAFLTLLSLSAASAAVSWDYYSNGPSTWPTLFTKWCSGRFQSPIALSSTDAYKDIHLDTYTFKEAPLNVSSNYTIRNDGHKVEILFGDHEVNVSLSHHETECYRPLGIHFHWGSDNTKGSEHFLDGKQFPMEGHIVMWDCKFYSTATEALSGIDGLAVLGIFFDVDSSVTSLPSGSPYQTIVDGLSSIQRCDACDTSATDVRDSIPPFTVQSLLPSKTDEIFVYTGSLTTPDCRENVLWTVFNTPIKIPQSTMDAFRNLEYPKHGNDTVKKMVNNYRGLLPLNPVNPVGPRRVLSRSFGPQNPSAAAQMEASVFGTLISVFLVQRVL